MHYFQSVFKELSQSVSNDYTDNWEVNRYGAGPKKSISLKQKIVHFLNKKNYYNLSTFNSLISSDAVSKFEYLYEYLEHEEDKRLLVKVLAYRLLGHTKVKLPLNNPGYWKKLKQLDKLSDMQDSIRSHFLNISLYKMNLQEIGFPIQLYYTPFGVMIDFVVKQYEYNNNGTIIKAEEGDTVIDAGGCWGDTALYFSNEVGDSGKVYTFEFIPNNISIMQKNFALNKSLEKNIELINQPVWSEPHTKIYYKDFGPGSEVKPQPFDNMDGECFTVNIDTLVANKKIEKVDFIKMDIEGAETNALKGAVETIRKFKPRLAITLYHSIEDFEDIPKLIKEIVPDYKLYFSHCTIYNEESVLFAEVEK